MSEVTAGFERIFERYLACSSICCKWYYLIISQQLFNYKGKLLNTYLGHTAKLQKARLLRRHRAYVHIHGIFIISTLNSGRIIRVLVFSNVPGYPLLLCLLEEDHGHRAWSRELYCAFGTVWWWWIGQVVTESKMVWQKLYGVSAIVVQGWVYRFFKEETFHVAWTQNFWLAFLGLPGINMPCCQWS